MRDASAAVLMFLATFALVLSAGVGARRLAERPDPSLQPRLVADWAAYGAEGHGEGDPQAPVTVVVFASYTCAPCAVLHRALRRIEPEGEVWVVRRHNPAPDDSLGWAAAGAVECAAEQGRFAAFEDALYEAGVDLGRASWEGLAARASVPDLGRFQGCIGARAYRNRIARDVAAADALEVRTRPSLLVRETLLSGVPADSLLDHVIRLAAFLGR